MQAKIRHLLKACLILIGVLIMIKLLESDHERSRVYEAKLYRNYSREYIIEETTKFMNRGVDEDDIGLIEFVQTLINPPSNKDYNFAVPNKQNGDYSQHHQSTFIDGVLKSRTGGFYIGTYLFT